MTGDKAIGKMMEDAAKLSGEEAGRAYINEFVTKFQEIRDGLVCLAGNETVEQFNDFVHYVRPAVTEYAARMMVYGVKPKPSAPIVGQDAEPFDEMTGPMDESGFGAGAGVNRG